MGELHLDGDGDGDSDSDSDGGAERTVDVAELATLLPGVHAALVAALEAGERQHRDLCLLEVAVDAGRLRVVRSGVAERSAAAAVRVAVDLGATTGVDLERHEAVLRVTPAQVEELLHPTLAQAGRVVGRGVPASPGAGTGRVYFSVDRALDAHDRGEDVVLVRDETSPADGAALAVARAVVTTRGGLTSHAAVVARGQGTPAVVGTDLAIDGASFVADGVIVHQGDLVAVDGTAGLVSLGQATTVDPRPPPELDVLLGWADDVRRGRLGVRANVDTPGDAARAVRLGADGVGLCRTEHLLLAPDRLAVLRRLLTAGDADTEAQAAHELGALLRDDAEAILEAMGERPVVFRLLDAPVHEFLAPGPTDAASAEAAERNPMLGTRGVRLAVLRPALCRAQVRAVAEAAVARLAASSRPAVTILVPLVVSAAELAAVRATMAAEVASVVTGATGVTGLSGPAGGIDVRIGAMIETPRAALAAAGLATVADLFSFGTNDLTQLTLGWSRDDLQPRLMARYLADGLLDADPFASLDPVVTELVSMAVTRGRAANPDLELGACGEHAGDPGSIRALYAAGVDHVSCSPFRVPVARLAAAHAVLSDPRRVWGDPDAVL